MPRTVTICGRECAVLDGKWNAKAGRWDLTVECPLPTCKARRRDTGIPKHLDDHDRSRDRAELKRNKIG